MTEKSPKFEEKTSYKVDIPTFICIIVGLFIKCRKNYVINMLQKNGLRNVNALSTIEFFFMKKGKRN